MEYINLQTWGYVNPGFKGSAIISAYSATRLRKGRPRFAFQAWLRAFSTVSSSAIRSAAAQPSSPQPFRQRLRRLAAPAKVDPGGERDGEFDPAGFLQVLQLFH